MTPTARRELSEFLKKFLPNSPAPSPSMQVDPITPGDGENTMAKAKKKAVKKSPAKKSPAAKKK